jgi:site-specific DNA-methyltransferase (adenine-specific)
MIFDECHRVLKPTGTVWVNLGDTYNNPQKYSNKKECPQTISKGNNRNFITGKRKMSPLNTLPSKSLCNIPNKFADEMILRGWILRNEIIWHKPACMPASVRDRFTNDIEKIFLFTKSQRYLFNQQFEEYAPTTAPRYKRAHTLNGKNATYRELSGMPHGEKTINPNGRNMRCVWRVSYEPSHEAHYAMFPSRLVERPVLAGSPVGGVVMDPFMGGGTTAVVAKRLGRHYIGFEPNAEYIAIAEKRLRNTTAQSLLFE